MLGRTTKMTPEEIDFLEQSNFIEDVWDAKSLDIAIKAWKYIKSKKHLTMKNILRTHAILMEGKLAPEETGAWRKRPVWIGGHEAKPWYTIIELMKHWVYDSSLKVDEEAIKQMHIEFEAIHPFIDGNGRMGRILLNWQRVKNGFSILIIWEDKKFDYYDWFN